MRARRDRSNQLQFSAALQDTVAQASAEWGFSFGPHFQVQTPPRTSAFDRLQPALCRQKAFHDTLGPTMLGQGMEPTRHCQPSPWCPGGLGWAPGVSEAEITSFLFELEGIRRREVAARGPARASICTVTDSS